MAFSSHAELISKVGATALARRITDLAGFEVSQKVVGGWRIRNSIPASYFKLVCEAAGAMGFADVTVEGLADLADLRRRHRHAETPPEDIPRPAHEETEAA